MAQELSIYLFLNHGNQGYTIYERHFSINFAVSNMICLDGSFFGICPPLGLLPVLGPCEWYMTPTLDRALLISSRAGTDPGLSSDSGV